MPIIRGLNSALFALSLGLAGLGGLGLISNGQAAFLERWRAPAKDRVTCVTTQLSEQLDARFTGMAGLDSSTYQGLLRLQKSRWRRLQRPFKIKTQAGSFTADTYIGGSSSAVFLDTRMGKVLKFYPLPMSEAETVYEELVTEYLLSRGEKVPNILASGHTSIAPSLSASMAARHPAEGYQVVVKDYVEGLTLGTLEENPSGNRSFDLRELRQEMKKQIHRIEGEYFGSGPDSFKSWLHSRKKDDRLPLNAGNVQHGDANEDNFLFVLGRGWVLNDP